MWKNVAQLAIGALIGVTTATFAHIKDEVSRPEVHAAIVENDATIKDSIRDLMAEERETKKLIEDIHEAMIRVKKTPRLSVLMQRNGK